MPATCFIFFRPGQATLSDAAQALHELGLEVDAQADCIEVSDTDSPTFRIYWETAAHVLAEAREIARHTAYGDAMAQCTERFAIQIEDLDDALDEVNTLMEIQATLQNISEGYLYLPWNESLLAP
ncbi:MAG: hypothetical protein LBE58_03120 [Comamonas sp.]|jgi:recombinational DNA repair protein (RecF pathway)|nr:hypothetical protein [Comamonas sp.]